MLQHCYAMLFVPRTLKYSQIQNCHNVLKNNIYSCLMTCYETAETFNYNNSIQCHVLLFGIKNTCMSLSRAQQAHITLRKNLAPYIFNSKGHQPW